MAENRHHRLPAGVALVGLSMPPGLRKPPRGSRAGTLAAPAVRETADESFGSALQQWLRVAPAWLVSCLVHMLAVIVLGLVSFGPRSEEPTIQLTLGTDTPGEQLEVDLFTAEAELSDVEELDLTTPRAPVAVEDPAAASAPEVVMETAGMAASPLAAPSISTGLAGREPGMRETLVAMYGGTPGTQEAVVKGLGWLVRVQDRREASRSAYGSWSLRGPYGDPAPYENREAATAMAMLAFQGYGVTHRRGPEAFREAVDLGRAALLRMQDRDGSLMSARNLSAQNQRIYAHCLATIALCELYGMSDDESLREPAQRAVDFLVSIQSKQGGWRYEPGRDSDLSVTGWGLMALKSARMAGLVVPEESFDRVSQYLDTVARDGGTAYIYGESTNEQPTTSMTAVGLLCRQYLGAERDDPRVVGGARRLLANPIDYQQKDAYEWYYSTQVLHQLGGEAWDEWNARMIATVPQQQQATGRDAGSWSPTDDEWGRFGGRLFQTCLSIYMLEVYYRHMPLYRVSG